MKNYLVYLLVVCSLLIVGSTTFAKGNDIELNNDVKDLNIVSSIQISDKATEIEERKAAKISVAEVVKSVLNQKSGKIVSVKLENEDTNLVYAVELNNSAGQLMDILVDAGNGQILFSQLDKPDDPNEADGGDPEDNNEEETKSWYEFW